MMGNNFNTVVRLRDLLEKLCQADCRVDGVAGMSGPRGRITHRHVIRHTADAKYIAPLPNMNDDDTLDAGVGRSLCVQLHLKPEDYGY